MTTISPYNEKQFLVVGHVINGFGDISCAMKFAKLMHEKLGIPLDKITVATNEPEKAALFNQKGFKILSYEDAFKLADIALKIFVPADTLNTIGSFLKASPSPMLFLTEYGRDTYLIEGTIEQTKSFWQAKSMGLNPQKDIGILIDEELAQMAEKTSPAKEIRIDSFKELSSSLQQFLLKETPNDETIQTFFKNTRIYLGYANSSGAIKDYIGAISHLNQKNEENILVIIPGKNPLTQNPYYKDENLIRYLAKQKIGHLSVQSFDEKSEVSKTDFNSDSQKTLHIIFGTFSHEDLRKLWLVTKKQTITTGDQSCAEAIACGRLKRFVYENQSHKTTHADALSKRYREAVVMNYLNQPLKFNEQASSNMCNAFAKSKKNKHHHFTLDSASIVETSNCLSHIGPLLSELLDKDHCLPIHVDPKTVLTPKNMEYDTLYLIDRNHINQLRILRETGTSENEEWKGSQFTMQYINDYYLIIRKKIDL